MSYLKNGKRNVRDKRINQFGGVVLRHTTKKQGGAKVQKVAQTRINTEKKLSTKVQKESAKIKNLHF